MGTPTHRACPRPSSGPLGLLLTLLFLLASQAPPAAAAPRWLDGSLNDRKARLPSAIPLLIEDKVHSLKKGKKALIAGERVVRRRDLSDFYARRGYKPAWIIHGRRADPSAWQLLDAIRKCGLDGLDPRDYHGPALDSLIQPYGRRFGWGKSPLAASSADLDLLLTDAYLRLASDMLRGRVNPVVRPDVWHVSPEEADLAAYLERAVGKQEAVGTSLRDLAPVGREYGIMKYWLAEYRSLAKRGGWPSIPAGPSIGPGSDGRRVDLLCRRLSAEKGLDPGICGDRYDSSIRYDSAMAAAVGRFQANHGLPSTGLADESTLRELNVPVEERIRQIQLNLECWRWLPRDLGLRHVRVNLADFSLVAWDGDSPGPAMKVVVGTRKDSTPVFSDHITAITLHPTWTAPDDIAAGEFLPALRRDPAFLERQGMKLFTRLKSDTVPILPDTVDWDTVDSAGFPFRIRQMPGEDNPLGRMLFVLANPFQIYLHDTPRKDYFNRSWRAMSHGCVRVERPVDLALWLLWPNWSRENLDLELARPETVSLRVAGKGVPVHILYWTAFPDPSGGLQFRRDIYGWDRRMSSDLRERTAGM